MLVGGDLLGSPCSFRGLEQRLRIGLAGDRRVADEPVDALVGPPDALLRGLDTFGELGGQVGSAGVVDGPVGELFEFAAALVVGGRRRVMVLAGLFGGA